MEAKRLPISFSALFKVSISSGVNRAGFPLTLVQPLPGFVEIGFGDVCERYDRKHVFELFAQYQLIGFCDRFTREFYHCPAEAVVVLRRECIHFPFDLGKLGFGCGSAVFFFQNFNPVFHIPII